MSTPIKNLAGRTFGRLTVTAMHSERIRGSVAWRCQCSCGNTHVVSGGLLVGGNTRSCGCLRRELATTHGEAGHGGGRNRSSEYGTWRTMLSRCENPNATGYRYWGGRGISVCERWHSYENFIADMGRRPHGFSLERIDNDKNYEPGNCKWASRAEQSANRSMRRMITANGRTMSLTEWATHLSLDRRLLWMRLHNGWSDERTINEPVRAY